MFRPLATISRRDFLQAGTASIVGATLTSVTSASSRAQGEPRVASVRALVFDVFGTVVDWRGSVAAQVEELAGRKGLTVDAARFADAWRAGYPGSMDRVRRGDLPWTKLDRLHRM